MAISEEQTEDSRDEFDAHVVFDLRDYAGTASIPNQRKMLDKLHDYAKKVFSDNTHEALEELSEEVDSLRAIVLDAAESLDNIDAFLSKTENKRLEPVYAEEQD